MPPRESLPKCRLQRISRTPGDKPMTRSVILTACSPVLVFFGVKEMSYRPALDAVICSKTENAPERIDKIMASPERDPVAEIRQAIMLDGVPPRWALRRRALRRRRVGGRVAMQGATGVPVTEAQRVNSTLPASLQINAASPHCGLVSTKSLCSLLPQEHSRVKTRFPPECKHSHLDPVHLSSSYCTGTNPGQTGAVRGLRVPTLRLKSPYKPDLSTRQPRQAESLYLIRNQQVGA